MPPIFRPLFPEGRRPRAAFPPVFGLFYKAFDKPYQDRRNLGTGCAALRSQGGGGASGDQSCRICPLHGRLRPSADVGCIGKGTQINCNKGAELHVAWMAAFIYCPDSGVFRLQRRRPRGYSGGAFRYDSERVFPDDSLSANAARGFFESGFGAREGFADCFGVFSAVYILTTGIICLPQIVSVSAILNLVRVARVIFGKIRVAKLVVPVFREVLVFELGQSGLPLRSKRNIVQRVKR